jgi:hypothetical protein
MAAGATAVTSALEGKGPTDKSVIPDAVRAGGNQVDADGKLILVDGKPVPVVPDVEAKTIVKDTGKITDVATAGGFVKNDDGTVALDGNGNPIPVIKDETVSTVVDVKNVADSSLVTAGTYTADTVATDTIIDPKTSKVTRDMIAEVENGALTLKVEGITISDEEAAKSLAEVITGTISPTAKVDAIKNTGTTLARVLRAKKQLRNAGLSEEQIASFADDPEALEDELMNYTEEEREVIGNLPEEALVGNQIAQLLEGIEEGEIPTWAKPAYATVMSILAQRGLDVSTVGRDALLNVIIQSAMPIAQGNASAIQQSVLQQVDIEAKAAESDAQRAQSVASQNAQNVFSMDMANFQAEQQTELFNKKFLQTVTLTNADNKQKAAMQNAAMQANMDISNLTKNERLAVTNAKTFLTMDLTNLNNEQQAEVISKQIKAQALLSNQAASNFAMNANATRETDVNKFMENLNVQIDSINAAATNNAKSFNANAKNAAEARRTNREADLAKSNAAMINDISKHNSMLVFETEKFNINNAQIVEANNVDWRRKTNLANTAADNAINMQNAMNSLGLQKTAMAMVWQELSDEASHEFTAAQNEATRKTQLLATALGNDGAGAAENWASSIGTLIDNVDTAIYGASAPKG